MYFVGIDIAKRFHKATVIDEQGKVATHQFSKFTRGLLQTYGGSQKTETTCRVINPLQSDALGGLFIHETKTDAIDAFIIAEVVRIGRYSSTEILPEDIHALCELCRQRFYIIDMAADIRRKIIALLEQVGV